MRREHRRRASSVWVVIPVGCALTLAWACASGGNADDAPPDPTGTGGSDAGGSNGAGGDMGAGGDALGPMGTGGGSAAGFPAMGGSSSGKGGASAAGGAAAGKGGSSGASGGSAGSAGSGMNGMPCTLDSQCPSMKCLDTGQPGMPNKICVDPCKTGMKCATGLHCTTIMGTPVCIPDRDGECAICAKDTDCKNAGDRCLTGVAGEKYCAQDCGYDGNCPTGYECKTVPMGNPGDKACSPTAAAGCSCGPNRDGATRACTNMTMMVTCTGTEKCDGKMAKYVGCNAAMPPAAGTCGPLPMGCTGAMGGGFPHATCSCTGASCALLCDAGYTHYPTSLPDSAGCPCKGDAGEPANDACATATPVTAISDAGMGTTKLAGTLSSDADVDWYDLTITNMASGGSNPYHVRMAFDANPGMELVFQVARGGDCAKAAAAPTLTTYDWCVNYNAGGVGEAPCGTGMVGLNQCADHSAPYKIGVKRSATAAMKTCASYSLTVQAAAGPCDAASIDACGMIPLALLCQSSVQPSWTGKLGHIEKQANREAPRPPEKRKRALCVSCCSWRSWRSWRLRHSLRLTQ